jgi:LytS/YehU family sensor histidine kinase
LNYEKQSFISLQQESEIVKDYLALEKIRFEERLEYCVDVEPELFEVTVPPSILLTLAENAIKHGINKLVKGGSIVVEVKKMESHVYIMVTNSGRITANEDKGRVGIGISNLNKRLKLFYHSHPELMLQQVKEDRVVASIQLPIEHSN